jgi:hypothetical protein
LAQPVGELGEPVLGPVVGQGEAQEEAGRIGALGGQIRDVHAQRLVGYGSGSILGQEMDALHQRIDGEHEIVVGLRRETGRIVLQAKGALTGDGREEAGDQAVFRRALHAHGQTRLLPSSLWGGIEGGGEPFSHVITGLVPAVPI